jgi:hypothetical protein
MFEEHGMSSASRNDKCDKFSPAGLDGGPIEPMRDVLALAGVTVFTPVQ